MDHPKACIYAVWLAGIVSAQTVQQGPTRTAPAVLVTQAASRTQLEPVILTRASLDEKVITLRLAPRVATSIRMPEPVNSVVVGDPENFQAEHSEHESELVTVKPVGTQAAQSNLSAPLPRATRRKTAALQVRPSARPLVLRTGRRPLRAASDQNLPRTP